MINKVEKYIKTWEGRCYQGGLVDEADRVLENTCGVPSYRKIAIALLENDLSRIGINGKRSYYYGFLKRIEINSRSFVKQLSLWVH